MDVTGTLKPIHMSPYTLFAKIVKLRLFSRLRTYKILSGMRKIDIKSLGIRVKGDLIYLPLRVKSQAVTHYRVHKFFGHENVGLVYRNLIISHKSIEPNF